MNLKFLVTLAAAGGLALMTSPSARADVEVNVEVGHPVHSKQYHNSHNRPDYDEEDYYDRISCGEGRSMVRRAGYYKTRVIECDGEIYRYAGQKRGRYYRVSVDADTGDIISVRRHY